MDKPSLGGNTVSVVSRLRGLLFVAKIVVLDEDPEASNIVEATLAGADVYAPKDQLADVILGRAQWTGRVAERPTSSSGAMRKMRCRRRRAFRWSRAGGL